MNKLRNLLNNQWFFPVLVLYYGIFYIAFGETYPLNGGMSMDGIVFSSFISDFTNSFFFDTYYVHRFFPSMLVGFFLKLFSISIIDKHIFLAFQILNLISIIISCYFLKQMLIMFKISLKNQILAYTLFLINFALLKFTFYLPVMTDTLAMAISSMMLFFYLKKNTIGVVICTLLACFTWQISFYQGLIFVVFPFHALPFSGLKTNHKNILATSSGLIALFVCIYLVLIKKMDTTLELVARIDKILLPISILGVVVIYFFFSKIFFNSNLFKIQLFIKNIKLKNIFYAFILFLITTILIYFLNPVPNKFYPLYYTLTNPFTHALMWPLHSFVSHTAYWGFLMILFLFFWTDFCKLISQTGWGFVSAFGLNLFLFGIMPETRCLINILPWIVLFLVKSLNKYSFSKIFYVIVGLFCAGTSKVWLFLNDAERPNIMQLDKNGSMGFPDQKFWMNIGPWMSEQMYYLQGGAILIIAIVMFFILYKVEVISVKKLKLVRKY